jgi:hypothetical protein
MHGAENVKSLALTRKLKLKLPSAGTLNIQVDKY